MFVSDSKVETGKNLGITIAVDLKAHGAVLLLKLSESGFERCLEERQRENHM